MALAAAEDDAPPRPLPVMSESELAGAAAAGEGDDEGGGGGGGGARCDMARRIQSALRRDPMVHAAVASMGGKAIRVWNGEWVWMPGDIGQGLTAVRQAMEFEIAYAPEACRAQAVHGLVVFNLHEPEGSVRLAFGVGDWRWTDLIGARVRR
jgi:hypothetical protein